MSLRDDVLTLLLKYSMRPSDLIAFLNVAGKFLNMPFSPRIHYAEITLARASGCSVICYPYNYGAEMVNQLDRLGAIVQIGLQAPDSPDGLHQGPDPYQALWVKASLLDKVKEILRNYPEAKLFV